MQYHVDGTLVPESEATVSVRDRGFAYGDAAFETMRAYGGEVFAWAAHVDRLQRSLDALGFAEVLPPREDLRARVDETLAANDLSEAYVKLSISRGVQPGTLTPADRVDPTIVVVVDELPRGGVNGRSVWDDPAVLETVATRRPPAAALPADAKTHNYLNGILARQELGTDADAADEALIRDLEGNVTEGATSNLFFVDRGTLKTPAASLPLLPGITRSVVLELAREEGIPVEQGRYEPTAFRGADEVFCTNTTWEVRPVTSVDGAEIEAGPMTELLARLYGERVERECYD